MTTFALPLVKSGEGNQFIWTGGHLILQALETNGKYDILLFVEDE